MSEPELIMVEIMSEPELLKEKPPKSMPRWLVVIPVIYLTLLIFAGFVHRKTDSINIFGLEIPILVFWFGTLGGVVDSLQGIFLKNKRWNHSYTIWHVFAGVVGAVYGLASYLFLQMIVNASSSTHPVAGSTKPAEVIFALAAFTIGYEQSKFHEMMDDIFKIIFKPVTSPDDPKTPAKPGSA